MCAAVAVRGQVRVDGLASGVVNVNVSNSRATYQSGNLACDAVADHVHAKRAGRLTRPNSHPASYTAFVICEFPVGAFASLDASLDVCFFKALIIANGKEKVVPVPARLAVGLRRADAEKLVLIHTRAARRQATPSCLSAHWPPVHAQAISCETPLERRPR